MRYGSVCSGIEAASVAWQPLGWSPAWFSEIEPFPSAVLAHHHPDVTNLGDMMQIAAKVETGEVEAPDILVGGTPCQAFSVAGLRRGLSDGRGQLSLEFIRLADAVRNKRIERGERAPIIVWENVPGVLSEKGNAFGCFIGALCGESEALQPSGKRWTDSGVVSGPARTVAWRVFDAQYFGLAQRRDVPSLSQVILTAASVPLKYYLSGTACAGILRRAEARGKPLPMALKAALLALMSRQFLLHN